MSKKTKYIILIIVITACFLTAAFIFLTGNNTNLSLTLQTSQVTMGNISKVVSATGTLEALTTVEVGTQVSGIIENLYVDFNSHVKKGQVIATIDTTNLSAILEQSRAAVENANAELIYQKANFSRMETLFQKGVIASSEYEQAAYSYSLSKANLKSVIAAYKRNKIEMDYAIIRSPIDGIVINRSVETGQTVAASFSTPTLFTIAQDLTQMQVEANVDEADIGQVKEGQRVTFTVDAYPDEIFNGNVSQLRIEPVISNNVVTYTIIITAPNPDNRLLPGMTATAEIYVKDGVDLLVIPSKAARFNPDEEVIRSYSIDNSDNLQSRLLNTIGEKEKDQKLLWLLHDSLLEPVWVQTGLDNDILIEIKSGLSMGDTVVINAESSMTETQVESTVSNPFMPKPPQRK